MTVRGREGAGVAVAGAFLLAASCLALGCAEGVVPGAGSRVMGGGPGSGLVGGVRGASADPGDSRAWVALRQGLRREPRGDSRRRSDLRGLMRPALAVELLSTPVCEEFLRTARVLRSEGGEGPETALASALEGAVSSLALDPRWATAAVLQRIELGDLRGTTVRARQHWLVERAGLGDAQERALRALEHGSCDARCARTSSPRDARGIVSACVTPDWHPSPHLAARALDEAVSNFLDGERKRE